MSIVRIEVIRDGKVMGTTYMSIIPRERELIRVSGNDYTVKSVLYKFIVFQNKDLPSGVKLILDKVEVTVE